MKFPARLSLLRKGSGLTQQALASVAEIHVNQVRRYEGGSAQPTLDVLVRIAKALRVSLDVLVFDEDERGPDDEFRFRFEALAQMDEWERLVVREVLDGLLLKHEARRLATGDLADV